MSDFYQLHMPESASPGHCLATFATALTKLSIELGTYLNLQMTARFGSNWFFDLKEDRVFEDSKYSQYKNFYDFSWIASESLNYPRSNVRLLLPFREYQFEKAMGDLRSARNQWFHGFNPHNISELRKALDCVRYISVKCGLELTDELVPVIKRVSEIASGVYQSPVANPEPAPATNTPEVTANPPALKQAAVGAAWLGPVGPRKVELTKSGSLIDLTQAKNVTAEMTDPISNRYLQLWKKLELDWLWVDSLGSVAANVHGSLRMVGYWGSEPEDSNQDPFAKFLLKNTYAIVGDVFYERDTNQALDDSFIGPVTSSTLKRARESVQEGEVLRLTWDGDLIYFGDQGPEYLGEIESSDWFAGHFFMPTTSS